MDLFMEPLNSEVRKWGMLCSYSCWTASWQMCELFSPYYAAWRSQEPKHHTLSSGPRWWSHANPSKKNVALGNELKNCIFRGESFQNPLRIMGLEYDNSIFLPRISHGFPFAYHVSLIVFAPFSLIWEILSWCSFHMSRSAFHHKTYTSLEYFHYLLWAMQCWKPNSTCVVTQEICSGEIILLLTLKLKYHGKLLSE